AGLADVVAPGAVDGAGKGDLPEVVDELLVAADPDQQLAVARHTEFLHPARLPVGIDDVEREADAGGAVAADEVADLDRLGAGRIDEGRHFDRTVHRLGYVAAG